MMTIMMVVEVTGSGYGSNGTIMVMVRAAFDMSNLNF